MARTRTKEAPVTPRYDAYFGLIVISLVATLTGLAFLYLDYSGYASAPKSINKTQAGAGFGAGVGFGAPNNAPAQKRAAIQVARTIR